MIQTLVNFLESSQSLNLAILSLSLSLSLSLLTASTSLKTRRRFPPANLIRSSVVHCRLISSSNKYGYLETSSSPSTNLF